MTCVVTFWTADNDRNELPLWARTVAVVSGDLYVPAAIAGNELSVTALSAWDDEPTIQHLDHAFVRSRWMASEFPRTIELLRLMERRVNEVVVEAQDAATQRAAETKRMPAHG